MKKRLTLLGIFAFAGMTGCISPQKYYQHGYYHEAAVMAIHKLQRHPDKKEYVKILTRAYPRAVEEDKEKIRQLEKQRTPEAYEKIADRYDRLHRRQKLLKTVLPLSYKGKPWDVALEDYAAKREEARRQAVLAYVEQARRLLRTTHPRDGRKAYQLLKRNVKKYSYWVPDYDSLEEAAVRLGTIDVFIAPQYAGRYALPAGRIDELRSIALSSIWKQWMRIVERADSSTADVILEVQIKTFDILPTEEHEKEYVYSRQDSTGTREVKIREIKRRRRGRLEGYLRYRHARTRKILHTSAFEHLIEKEAESYAYSGDLGVAPPDLVRKIKNARTQSLPDPDRMAEEMLEWMKEKIKSDLRQRKEWLAKVL